MATPSAFTGDSTVPTTFSQPSEGGDPHHDTEEDPGEVEEVCLKELGVGNILLKPDQQEDTPSPFSSLRSIGSTNSHDHLVSSPVSPCLHRPEHEPDNVSIDVPIDDITSIGSQKRDEVIPEILISNSDGVTENKANNSVSSKLVVVSQKFPFNFDETHCNLDATIPFSSSMTTSVSSKGTSDLVTSLSAISSDVLKEEDIENSKYNLEVAPVYC